MTDLNAPHDDHSSSHHITSVKAYGVVIACLFVLMFLTVYASFFHFGDMANPILALAIAVSKAILIVMIFMNVRYSSRLTQIFVAGGFFWLLILFGMIIIDFVSRRMMTDPQSWMMN